MTATTDMIGSAGNNRPDGAGSHRDDELDAALGQLERSHRHRHSAPQSVYRKACSRLRALVAALQGKSLWR
jgi:hypothetical protein